MKRRSRLTVLVRLARLEESATLARFGAARRALDGIRLRLEDNERDLRTSGHTGWLGTHERTSPADLRAADRHSAHLAERGRLLELERQTAARALEEARRALATARLRTKAFEDAERRRHKREARAALKREQRRLEESHRHTPTTGEDGGTHASS